MLDRTGSMSSDHVTKEDIAFVTQNGDLEQRSKVRYSVLWMVLVLQWHMFTVIYAYCHSFISIFYQ